jgi:hypothetical protein
MTPFLFSDLFGRIVVEKAISLTTKIVEKAPVDREPFRLNPFSYRREHQNIKWESLQKS